MTRIPSATVRLRRVKAVAIVVGMVIAVPGVEALSQSFGSPQVVATVFDGGLNAAYLTESRDADVALNRLEDVAAADGADVPEAFSREIGFLSGARDIRASGGGSVIGYVVSLESDEAASRLTEHMTARGWTAVALGGLEGATFVKREGSYRWSLVTCTQVGSVTSIVVRSVVT